MWRERNGFKIVGNDRYIIFFIFVLNTILHGKHAFTLNYLFDTDDVLYFGQSTLNWLEIGRQGAVFTKKLFGLLWYNPYFVGIVGIVLFSTLQYLIIRLLSFVGTRMSKQSALVFVAVFATSPIWVYQFYFSVQWIEIVWAMLLLVFVEYLSYILFGMKQWYRRKPFQKFLFFIGETMLLIWAFSTYQAMVGVFITLCASLYLLSLTDISMDKEMVIDYVLRGVWQVVVFGMAYLANNILTQQFFSSSNYVVSQRVWGVWDTSRIMEGLKTYIKYSYMGLDIHYTWLMGLSTIGALIVLLRVMFKKKYILCHKCLFAVAMSVTIISVHLLNIYCGRATAVRSQIAYPFATGFLCFYIIFLMTNRKEKGIAILKYAVLFVLFAGATRQMENTLRLWYTDDVKCRIDMEIMEDVVDEIHELGLGYSPSNQVVFVGNLHPKLNESCYDINPSEYSVFDCSVGVSCWRRVDEQPNRLVRMIQSHLGMEFVRADWDRIVHARDIAGDMPCYPNEGYVQLREDIIIVKMGN